MDSSVSSHSDLCSSDLVYSVQPRILKKRCRVCGDRAVAFHYDGLCCESCKTFFRRNAANSEEFTCPKRNCTININTRKYCIRCRLDKCFEIGMKRELLRIAKTTRNGYKNKDKKVKSKSETIISSNNAHSNCVHSDVSIQSHRSDFSEYERNRIVELAEATSIFCQGTKCTINIDGNAEDLVHVFQLQEFYIRRIIQFCKRISSFASIREDDQLAMVKMFFPEMFILLTSFHYNVEKDCFPIRMTDISETALHVKIKLLFEEQKPNVIKTYRKYVYSLYMQMELDTTIRDMMSALLLFSPRENVSCCEYIRYQYFTYCALLQKYLLLKYRNSAKASRKYGQIMSTLAEMLHVKDILLQTYMNIELSLVSDVLAEIYHLNRS